MLIIPQLPTEKRSDKRRTQPGQEHISGLQVVLGSDFHRDFVIEKWSSGGPEGGVSLWDNSLGFEVLHEFMVWIVQVKFKLTKRRDPSIPDTKSAKNSYQSTNLVNSGNDGCIRQDLFFQLLLGEVRDPDALDLSGFQEIFHLLPGIFEFPIEQDVTARTIWEGGEIWVVSVRVEGNLGKRASRVHRSVRYPVWEGARGDLLANGPSKDQRNQHLGSSE